MAGQGAVPIAKAGTLIWARQALAALAIGLLVIASIGKESDGNKSRPPVSAIASRHEERGIASLADTSAAITASTANRETETGQPRPERRGEESQQGSEVSSEVNVDAGLPDATQPDVVAGEGGSEVSATDRFRQGYRDGGGPAALEQHFVEAVLPCESPDGHGGIDWAPGNANYRSAAQFHPASWARVEREVGRQLAFEDPYDVGLAVATWLELIDEPGGTGGWPVCFW